MDFNPDLSSVAVTEILTSVSEIDSKDRDNNSGASVSEVWLLCSKERIGIGLMSAVFI